VGTLALLSHSAAAILKSRKSLLAVVPLAPELLVLLEKLIVCLKKVLNFLLEVCDENLVIQLEVPSLSLGPLQLLNVRLALGDSIFETYDLML
jgi:hypothetical protein